MFGKKKRKVFIVSACRTPIGNFGGMLKNYSAVDLGAAALRGAIQKININDLESFLSSCDFARSNVFMGNVLLAGLGQNPARQAAHKAGFSWESPCVTINKVCGSGMQAIICAYDAIKSGRIDVAFSGGMESMSNVPYLVPRPVIDDPKKGLKPKIGDFTQKEFDEEFIENRMFFENPNVVYRDVMNCDGLTDAYSGKNMIQVADECAQKWGITRKMQDEYAVVSNKRAIYATKNNLFKKEIMAVENFSEDEGIKQFKPEKIPELKPVFEGGSVTAANASKMSDGVAALMIASEEIVEKFGITPLAEIIDMIEYGGLPEDFPIAPSRAIIRLLEQNRLISGNIDYFEINEALAVVPLIFEKIFSNNENCEFLMNKVNVCGGAVALGHPIGASGARIVVTLVHTLSSDELGIAAICIGGGEALAMLVKKI